MSYNLWRAFFEDDVDSFRQYLANATFSSGAPRTPGAGQVGGATLKIGSPGNLAVSPKTPFKFRKSSGTTPTAATLGKNAGLVLTRAEVNTKDNFGRTILHHAASSQSDDSLAFVKVLLEMPFLDLYVQDLESGWTPLHRALYFGNISIAHALMARDIQDATDYTTNAQHSHAGGLVKIKDHEGNSPFEVFGLTIAPRSLQQDSSTLPSGIRDDDSINGADDNGDHQDHERSRRHVTPSVDLVGDEVYAFGSNKNLSLGLGDGDDRHFPERLHFERPDHLLRRLLDDHLAERRKASVHEDLADSVGELQSRPELPAIIRYRPITVQNVVMSKLHTAVLTNDPISNLYICGYGPGGRLGTGDENTSFTYRCIQAGGLAKRRISSIALGQDHSVAVCSQGEVYTWGSNRFGQLGYALPEVSKNEVPTQLVPRQLFGYIKKEIIIGAAASAIHSAIYTASAIYTFGKNEGQLGLTDAEARSLEMQVLPRRVGVSVLQSPIQSVSAIDRATIVLLENHDVFVFTHYGWTKVIFPLETFTNYYIGNNLSTRFNVESNYIKQITSGGNTICAMSSFGEVYSIDVPKVPETVPSSMSTTNPTKARNALPAPSLLWSLRKAHMSAIDVAVGQDGSIILCTASGSAWRKEKRANMKSVRDTKLGSGRPKDYKFVRIPNLTGVIAVRSNAFGAFTAVRKDVSTTRDQIVPVPPSLWRDAFRLLSFREYGLLHSVLPGSEVDASRVAHAVINRNSAETDILNMCQRYEPLSDSQYDLWITSTVTDVRIPVHSFILKGRSRVMRSALAEVQETYYYSIPDIMSIEYGQDGQIQVSFQGADFLTLVNLVLYLYTDNLVDVWHYTSKALQSASRYRSVRVELMRIANHLEMRSLERAVRVMVNPVRSLANDMELAVVDPDFFSDADVVVELADNAELLAHSVLLCSRCPFFDGLFNGRAGGMWMASRRNTAEEHSEAVRVDLKHIDEKIFVMVLRHLYADTGDELFDDILTNSLDEFVNTVIELMSVANELMLDRLAQICQKILGRHVNIRNVCPLVNIAAECTVDSFKNAALEYICLNLESMLELKLLDDLDEDLLVELDKVVQANQLAFLPFARSNRAEAQLLENYPSLLGQIEAGRQTRIDSMRLRSRLVEDEGRFAASMKTRYGSLERSGCSPQIKSSLPTPVDLSPPSTPSRSPAIKANDAEDDLPFDMDGDEPEPLPAADGKGLPSEPSRNRLSLEGTAPSLSTKLPVNDSPPSMARSREGFSSSLKSNDENWQDTTITGTPTSGFAVQRTPWGVSANSIKKDGLKDIMEQASAARVSNLTQAMRTFSTGSKATVKVSQKERKRQQQQIKEQVAKPSSPSSANPSTNSPSPWQAVAKTPRADFSPTASAPIEAVKEIPAKQPMTMRQTIARATSTTGPSPKGPAGAGPAIGLTAPPKPSAPQIQSIRHTPLPTRISAVDARTSMADILAQQQIEKTAVKEAVAKKSLQEIQQEQEFQEWWDNESRRVQEQEAQANSAAARRGKGGRGRGGQRRGGGRGKGTSDFEVGGQQKPSSLDSAPARQESESGRGIGRGNVSRGSASNARARGQGKSQYAPRGGKVSILRES